MIVTCEHFREKDRKAKHTGNLSEKIPICSSSSSLTKLIFLLFEGKSDERKLFRGYQEKKRASK